MKKLIFVIITIMFISSINAQHSWIFGENAGLNFGTGPSPLTSATPPAISGDASSAMAYDNLGDLLFYSDGISIWDKNNILISSSLLGSTGNLGPTVLILPQPGVANIFFIFYCSDANLYATKINASSLGVTILELNHIVYTSSSVGSIRSITGGCKNGIGWVVVAPFSTLPAITNTFVSFKVDATTVSLSSIVPVISNLSTIAGVVRYFPIPLKLSNNLNKIAFCSFAYPCTGTLPVCTASGNFIAVYDFDAVTGLISISSSNSGHRGFNFPVPSGFFPSFNGFYGLEFSPNDNNIFISTYENYSSISYSSYTKKSQIYELDISNPNWMLPAWIYYIGEVNFISENQPGVSLALAPNGKIYIAKPGNNDLAVINNPNALSLSTLFNPNGPGTIFNPAHGSVNNTHLPNIIRGNCPQPLIIPCTTILTTNFTNANCSATNGTASVISSGGTAPYTYSWNTVPIQTTATATGLAAGSYIVTVTDANGCVKTETITVGSNPCPPPCTCGNWGSIGYTINTKSDKFLCSTNGSSTTLQANQGDLFSLNPVYNCIGGTVASPCNATFKYDIYFPKGGILLGVTSIANKHLDSCGINRIVMTPYCNGIACPPCEFNINVNCCHCNPLLTPIVYGPLSTGKDSAILSCGQTYTNLLDCFKEYIIKVKNPCGETCQPDEVVTTITYPNGTSAVSHSVLGIPFSIGTDIGNYEVLIQVKCNGVWCKECKLIFKQTKACQPPCDNCKNQDGTSKVQAMFNSGSSSVAIQNYPLASTLNANILLGGGTDTYTQVRVNVVDIQISSDNPDCLQCYNNPNQWGSIISGTCSIPSFVGTSTTYGTIPTTTPYNNSREIVFNNSTATAIPMGTALNLNIQIPGISTLSCCCLNVKVFVKITYRNNKCEECSKIVLIDLTECPGTGTTSSGQGGGGIATFNQPGHPQYRIASPNKDAGIPVNFNNKPSN